MQSVALGTAGWSIPKAVTGQFPGAGTHLQRYAAVMPCCEINSSFHKPHSRVTYERWAASTPDGFRFAAKLPKTITHVRKLRNADELVSGFVEQVAGLGTKLSVVLVQLPPKMAFESETALPFFAHLRNQLSTGCRIACEPRNAGWFTEAADNELAALQVARVAADPVLVPGGDRPGGWRGLHYRRLHGSPRVYYSAYGAERLSALAAALAEDRRAGVDAWCIFDNTASGAALNDALNAQSLLTKSASSFAL